MSSRTNAAHGETLTSTRCVCCESVSKPRSVTLLPPRKHMQRALECLPSACSMQQPATSLPPLPKSANLSSFGRQHARSRISSFLPARALQTASHPRCDPSTRVGQLISVGSAMRARGRTRHRRIGTVTSLVHRVCHQAGYCRSADRLLVEVALLRIHHRQYSTGLRPRIARAGGRVTSLPHLKVPRRRGRSSR